MAKFKFLVMSLIYQIIFNIVFTSALYILIALSFSIIYYAVHFFHMAHAVSITAGAYLVYTMVVMWNLPLLIAIPFSIVIVTLLMLGINEWVYKLLWRKNSLSWQLMIASLGLYVIFQNVVSMLWGDGTLSFRTWEEKTAHEFYGVCITDVQLITLIVCAVLLLLIWFFMEKTNSGKQIKAVSSDDELSSILGLNRNRAIMWSFAIGTALAACAGILIAADTDMTPTMGFNWLLYAVVAMIIGGMGKTRYLVLGALLLATAQHLAAFFLDSKWMNATAYIILIVFLLLRPTGFSGKLLRKANI